MRSISSKITLSEGKGKKKKKQKGGRMEEKKAMVALLGFIFATLEIGFDKKKSLLDGRGQIYIYMHFEKHISEIYEFSSTRHKHNV